MKGLEGRHLVFAPFLILWRNLLVLDTNKTLALSKYLKRSVPSLVSCQLVREGMERGWRDERPPEFIVGGWSALETVFWFKLSLARGGARV